MTRPSFSSLSANARASSHPSRKEHPITTRANSQLNAQVVPSCAKQPSSGKLNSSGLKEQVANDENDKKRR
eukprot:5636661-Amphidinium_carterae.1